MEKFVLQPEKTENRIEKVRQDPIGLFFERFGQALDVPHAAAGRVDFSYLTPAQRAESMWAVFQEVKNLVRGVAADGIDEKDLPRLQQNVGVLKSFYDDRETRQTYGEQYARHTRETDTINGGAEKRKKLDQEINGSQATVDACARQIFSERGGRSSEVDKLLFETSRRQLGEKQKELEELVQSNPELGGLDQYQKLREGAEQLKKEGFIWTPSRRKILEELEEAAFSGKPVLLSGESGTGKTRLVEQAALKLTGLLNNQTSGKDTRLQDLIAKRSISPDGETYYEYREIGEAATGRTSTLEKEAEHNGRIVADDEFNLLPEAEQTERLARIATWTPGKTVRMPVTNQEAKIGSNFLYCAMVNLASERYSRKKIPPEVLRKFAKVDVGYLEQSAENPEIYEAMLSALLDENGRLRVAKGEMEPAYEFREEMRTTRKDGQENKQTVNIRELKMMEEKDGKVVQGGGFVWRLANALNEINKSFSHKETVLKVKGEAQFLKDLIIDIGTILGWMKEYGGSGRGKNLEAFFAEKMQKEFLAREAYSVEDRQLVKEFLKYFDIDAEKTAGKEKSADQEFEIMTPLEIGLLSPRVKYEKVVSSEPILAESYFMTAEGQRVEYRIQPIEKEGQKFAPGQIFEMEGKIYEFLGIDKTKGDPVYAPYKEKPRKDSRREKTKPTAIKTNWRNPESGQEQMIEIDFEKFLVEQKVFYKNKLGLEIDEAKFLALWKEHYTEIKSEIEKYGYDSVLIVPDNLPDIATLNKQLVETMEESVGGKKTRVVGTWQSDNFKSGGSFAGVTNSGNTGYRIVLNHSEQNIYNNPAANPLLRATLGKNILDLTGLDEKEIQRRIASGQELPVNCEVEINGQKILIESEGEALDEYLLQQAMYFEKTGQHLDVSGWNWLMKSFSGARVVNALWDPSGRLLGVDADDSSGSCGGLGLRLSRSFS